VCDVNVSLIDDVLIAVAVTTDDWRSRSDPWTVIITACRGDEQSGKCGKRGVAPNERHAWTSSVA
jgi:hypothetical protein